jgi:hypothetical protein
MTRNITDDELTKMLNDLVKDHGGPAKFARMYGSNITYVSNVIHGRKPPSRRMLEMIGIEKTTEVRNVYLTRHAAE